MLAQIKNFFKQLKERRLERNNKIVLFGIFEKKDPSFEGFKTAQPNPIDLMKYYTPVTVAPTRKDVIKAMDKLIYFNHFDHFSLWCASHGYQDTCAWVYPYWDQYKRDVLSPQELKEEAAQYGVFTLTYSRQDVSSLIRTISQCEPLLLPYEKDIELPSYLSHYPILPDHFAKIIVADTVDGAKLKNFFATVRDEAEKIQKEKKEEEN